jgi:hypothetical protein
VHRLILPLLVVGLMNRLMGWTELLGVALTLIWIRQWWPWQTDIGMRV